ncbi:hypothetical protein, partial [Streptomyces gilvus]|uniref:hypothetical protein n=1 Tax=Streptomyces gilvus TaxID=2920937 RepID=UPI0035A879DE|nr:hypothetical protein [Streptomyces sp. CME 23]
GAITSRQLLLETKVSFLGKEDTDLKVDLAQELELAGILNWAMEGMRRLEAQGHFTEPEAARVTRQEMEDKANPLGVFIDEEVVLDESLLTRTRDVFDGWRVWSRKGEDTRSAETMFGSDLKIALAARGVELKRVRRTVDGERDYFYVGVGLRNPVPAFARVQPR